MKEMEEEDIYSEENLGKFYYERSKKNEVKKPDTPTIRIGEPKSADECWCGGRLFNNRDGFLVCRKCATAYTLLPSAYIKEPESTKRKRRLLAELRAEKKADKSRFGSQNKWSSIRIPRQIAEELKEHLKGVSISQWRWLSYAILDCIEVDKNLENVASP